MDEQLHHLLTARGVMSTRQLATGGVSRSRLSRATGRGDVVRVLPRVYATGPLPPWPSRVLRDGVPDPAYVLQVRAVLLSLGTGAVAAGRTAAVLRGWDLLVEPVGVVDVLVPHVRTRARLPRTRVRRRRGLVAEGGGPRVLGAVDTVVDCSATLPLLEAVVVLDSALRCRSLSLEMIERVADTLRGRPGRRLRRVVAMTDPAAGSVLESVLRVRFVQAGLEGWETQQVLCDAKGRRILRADFCFRAARLVVETDGRRWHQDAARDQRVDNLLAAAGWRVLRFSWAQVVHEPDRVLDLVRAALSAGGPPAGGGAGSEAAG